MKVQEQDIRDITGAVWTNVLQTTACPPPDGSEPELLGTVMTGCVQISGAWQGAVTLQCTSDLARAAAATMFETDPARTSPEEIRDALGELVNMVGGNIKALLGGSLQLSLPLVVEGTRDALCVCEAVAVHRVWFASQGEAFAVTLFSRVEAA